MECIVAMQVVANCKSLNIYHMYGATNNGRRSFSLLSYMSITDWQNKLTSLGTVKSLTGSHITINSNNRSTRIPFSSLFKFILSQLNVATLSLQNLHFHKFSIRLLQRPSPSKEMATLKRWLKPEVYPLFAAVGVAVGICGLQLVRNICINPDVRISKENRSAGILENFAEGERYAEHSLRKFVRNKAPEIMPTLNSFFTDPNQSSK